jgi:hypothetical protein
VQIAEWVCDVVWRSSRWSEALAARVETEPGRLYDLATATEYIVADRARALALYVKAWRAGHAGSKAIAKALAIESRAHDVIAEIALDDGDRVAAAAAFVDGGLFAKATEALVGAPATAESKTLAALAKKELRDPHREASSYLARGQFVYAARIAKLANLEPVRANALATAAKKLPNDPEIALLVEDRLLERGNAEELLEHYRVKFERAPNAKAWVGVVRAAACELIQRGKQPGLGLRLLRRSLQNAYTDTVTEIARHVAAWELLVENARASQSMRELAPLVFVALRVGGL